LIHGLCLLSALACSTDESGARIDTDPDGARAVDVLRVATDPDGARAVDVLRVADVTDSGVLRVADVTDSSVSNVDAVSEALDAGPRVQLDWVRIEGGRFLMGPDPMDEDEYWDPAFEVTVPTFDMMRTEVTVSM
jgi:formylglycine-generating enzyme required for sulfatase activity